MVTVTGDLSEQVNLGEGAVFIRNLIDELLEQIDLTEEVIFGRTLEDELTDNTDIADRLPVIGYGKTISEATNLLDLVYRIRLYSPVVSEGLGFSESTAQKYNPGPTISETIGLTPAVQRTYNARYTVSDVAQITEAMLAGLPRSITESMTVGDVLLTIRGIQVIERLGLAEIVSPQTMFRLTVSERVQLRETLARFFGADASDNMSISEALLPKKLIYPTATDGVRISETVTPRLILRVTAADALNLSDAELLKMVLSPTIREELQISAAYVGPGNTFTSWAVNTRTGATTEYDNFEFNSFAQVGTSQTGTSYLGASSEGLFELVGDTDAGQDIVAKIKSGFLQFSGSRYSSFKAAYLGMRGDGYVYLKVDTGDGKSYTYRSMLQNMQTTKVIMGKGLRARYFAFELVTVGQDFDLDTIEFIPITANRRV